MYCVIWGVLLPTTGRCTKPNQIWTLTTCDPMFGEHNMADHENFFKKHIFVCQSPQTGSTSSRLVNSEVELILLAFTLLTNAMVL